MDRAPTGRCPILDVTPLYKMAYPMPIGSKGIAMVGARDIAEVAAIELIRRDHASQISARLSAEVRMLSGRLSTPAA